MAKEKVDKPIDATEVGNQPVQIPVQDEEKQKLAAHVMDLFRGAYNAKTQMNLMEIWATCDDYLHNIQNEPESEDDPGSVTNIIKPIIDSEISDIIDKPYDVDALGREPGDHMYADDVQHAMKFVLDKNYFKEKLTESEHDRLELGTTVVKVFTDHEALQKRGLPTFEIVSPGNFFPDPKWTKHNQLQECEFLIHAVPKPLSWFKRTFPETGKYVKRQVSWMFDPTLDLDTTKTDEVAVITSQKALLIECYMRDENGDVFCVHVANGIVLEDSRKNKIVGTKLQRRNLFPFVAIICYPRRGTGWGMGDVEYLLPTQDLINDMDDQIRMSARLMGNPQVAISLPGAGKGFDARKWTNKPGLRVPMRDINAFKVVQGANITSDVPARREKAFEEANIISGRPDVNRGNTPGSGVTAASAIIALQQAGQKTVVHKMEMLKLGWTRVLELLYDEMVMNWDTGMWIRINGDKPDYRFIDPGKLSSVPLMVPNLEAGANQDNVKKLLDESGVEMTREAEFDLQFNLGNGLPTDKAFVYQTLLDLAKLAINGQPVISWQEIRDYLRNQVGIPLQSDSSMQTNGVPGVPMPGMPPLGEPTPSPAGIPGQLRVMQGGAPQ
jgi:hypothetical protein